MTYRSCGRGEGSEQGPAELQPSRQGTGESTLLLLCCHDESSCCAAVCRLACLSSSRSARCPGCRSSRNLPRAPPSKILTGHRGPVTCLATHPVFAMLASGSEDATIKASDPSYRP